MQTEKLGRKLTRLACEARQESQREANKKYADRFEFLINNERFVETLNSLLQEIEHGLEKKAKEEKYSHEELIQMYDIFPRSIFPEDLYRDEITYQVLVNWIIIHFNEQDIGAQHQRNNRRIRFYWEQDINGQLQELV
jgi:hemerythrin